MIILDTNVISEMFRAQPNQQVIAWLKSLSEDVAITSITLAELMAGVKRLPEGHRKTRLQADLEVMLQPYLDSQSVIPFGAQAALIYGDVLAEREKLGRPISTPDAQIAAICRERDAVCATRNIKDFEGTGVKLFNPWE